MQKLNGTGSSHLVRSIGQIQRIQGVGPPLDNQVVRLFMEFCRNGDLRALVAKRVLM